MNDALVPIVIGVTGHRDLDPGHYSKIKEKVEEVFKDIRMNYPNSPIVLLSPLAEGADRLVAHVALGFAAELVVPIPMPVAEYLRDFSDAASRSEFQTLLGGPKTTSFELPLAEGNRLEDIREPGECRDKQYTGVGAYIARHSQILIALWNGIDPQKAGGTACIVKFKLEGIPQPYAKPPRPLSQIEGGPVYHILTPRLSDPIPIQGVFTVRKLFPEYWGSQERAEESYKQVLRSVDRYNADVKKHGAKLHSKILKSRSYVVPDDIGDALEARCKKILNQYAFADVLAQRFKNCRLRTIISLFSLVMVAFFFFQMYLGFWPRPIVLLLYPLIMLCAVILFETARTCQFEYKHEDYRALAEAMRVQFFWELTGVDEEVADHYLHKHKGQLEWIRYAIRVWRIPFGEKQEIDASRYQLAYDYWVTNQRNYFSRRTRKEGRIIGILHWTSIGMFVAGPIVAFILFFRLSTSSVKLCASQVSSVQNPMILLIGMFLAIAAALQGYLDKVALSEQSKQYERMASLYSLASQRLKQYLGSGDFSRAQELLMDLGKEALLENGDWLLLHRARPLEVPSV
jgi:hypothetical protein